MKQAQTDVKEMMAEIGREPGRSSLFWDFYDNHAAMLRAKGVGRFHWKDLSARVAARGLTDANGNAPDQQTTKKTWLRVCQLKAREQAARDKQQRTRNREPERGVNAEGEAAGQGGAVEQRQRELGYGGRAGHRGWRGSKPGHT